MKRQLFYNYGFTLELMSLIFWNLEIKLLHLEIKLLHMEIKLLHMEIKLLHMEACCWNVQ